MQREHTSKALDKKDSSDESGTLSAGQRPILGAQLGPVYFLVVIFLLNFISRIILSPLLPTIEKELAVSHSEAGFFFFLTSGGYLAGLLASGLLASRANHRAAIVLSSAGVGVAMLTVAATAELILMRGGLFGVGFAAGLYMPSAIATITSLVDRAHWGKAISVHELAPNVAFFVSPFIAELFLKWASWRSALAVLGALSILASLSFARFGSGGDFAGESPLSRSFSALARAPTFWLMIVLFGLGVSSTVGVYAMLPLYLVTERGFESSWANTILAFSRSHGPFLGLLGGWASDKFGAQATIVISLAVTGIITLSLGLLSDPWLSTAVFFQPLLAVWFFPAAFAAISMSTSPNARNLAVAFTVPFGFLIGGGIIPIFIGAMGDAGAFAIGFTITGMLISAGALLALLVKLPDVKQ